MSPHAVSGFVSDLVEMAKAMERLPGLEAENERLSAMIEEYAKTVQDREISIIGLKSENEILHSRICSLEVARDDAELRFLEVKETAKRGAFFLECDVVSHLQSALEVTKSVMLGLDPPKPEPVVELQPQAVPPAKGQSEAPLAGEHVPSQEQSASVNQASAANFASGQSEPDPTASVMDTTSETALSGTVSTSTDASTAHSDDDLEPMKFDDYGHIRQAWSDWSDRKRDIAF